MVWAMPCLLILGQCLCTQHWAEDSLEQLQQSWATADTLWGDLSGGFQLSGAAAVRPW